MKSKKKTIIGGEKIFPLSILFSTKKNDIFSDYEKEFNNFCINYTFGGYYSLLAIIDDLNLRKNSYVLLPSYLCPSILKPFQDRNTKYAFYRIDANLSPDINNIKELLNKDVKAVLFIDYMGKSQIENVLPLHSALAKKGVKIIQDCVQTIYIDADKIYGDYAFNSFRKTTPFEGSVIISKNKMKICFTKGLHYKFLFYKRIGQILRYFHIHYNIFKPSFFLRFIEKAELAYQIPKIYNFPKINRSLIRKIDLKKLYEKNRMNYKLMMNKFITLTPRHLQSIDFKPFGFFMLITDRDKVRAALGKNDIFCPIHWTLPKEINETNFKESHDMTAKEITIPIADLNETRMSYLLKILNKEIIQ